MKDNNILILLICFILLIFVVYFYINKNMLVKENFTSFEESAARNYEIESDNTIKSKAKKTKAPSYNPLTRYPLSDYTVKGVITSNEGNRALISTDCCCID